MVSSSYIEKVSSLSESKEPIISVRNLSFTYRTHTSRKPNLLEAARNAGRAKRSTKVVKALSDISFDVERGSVLGIIGTNGAGKSTLMRAIGGMVPPTSGEIEVHGKVSALLALGVGFNKNLTGRENVILGGLASGLTREQIEEKFEDVVAFAELEEVIDQPMRTYSSGMFSRLGFAVATTMDPDILLIDEALSTGDAHFKEKSAARIRELRDTSGAMLIVSHALKTLDELCNEILWINKGQVVRRGEPSEIIAAYKDFLNVKDSTAAMDDM